MKNRRLLGLLGVLLAFTLVAAACGNDSDDAGDTNVDQSGSESPDDAPDDTPDDSGSGGGTLIWAHEQEPPELFLENPNNNLTVTSWIWRAMLEGLYGIDSTTSYYPQLLDGEATITDNGDGSFTVTGAMRSGMVWSDGDPLDTADLIGAYNIITEGCTAATADEPADCSDAVYQLGDKTGYDFITDIEAISDTEFSWTMNTFYAGWKGMFGRLYPSHVIPDATTANELFPEWRLENGDPIPSSGAMIFDNWERGVAIDLVRNDNYNGSMSPDAKNPGVAFIDGVRINFVADTDAQINALKSGEAHVIMTQPQLAFGERLGNDENITLAASAGPVFEHWGFNLLNPHLSDSNVREALLFALDKSEVMAALYTPLFGDLLPAEGLGGTYWMSNQPDYEDHQADYAGPQIAEAQAKLEASGYVLGDDGIYEHPERGRLTLRVGTTGGNALRELQQELIQQQMLDAGIEIVIDNVPGGAYFGERPFAEEALLASSTLGAEGDPTIWDITQFAWVGGPWPGGQTVAYRSDSGDNPYGYQSADFDTLSDQCDATVDDQERADCYNELDKLVTQVQADGSGLVVMPLTQKPSFYAYNSAALSQNGVSPDANNSGPLENVQDYQFG
jgi:ABC-type transport system substrate-binding protein